MKITKNHLDDDLGDLEQNETSANWLIKRIEMQNEKGHTFMAVAVNKTKKETEAYMVKVLEWMNIIFGENIVSGLCEKTDKGGNNLAHLVVDKSLAKLVTFILKKTLKADKIFNGKGYNQLHLSKQTKLKFQQALSGVVEIDRKRRRYVLEGQGGGAYSTT